MATSEPADAVAAALWTFVRLVGRVHDTAVALHEDPGSVDHNITGLSAALSDAVDALRGVPDPESNPNALVQRCIRLGADLLIRLDRVQSFVASSPPGADLHSAWPTAAVEALENTFQTLSEQWCVPIHSSTQLDETF